ncbi:MAG TPA: nitroreductase family protein [Candidatus Gastranaerophilaceae bacterium]|nr:nitroreductase family protein [Candidatus Gastranaerophilaceae bacterium]HPT41276.1 nitroreductase family protein [Candidatus Gastranaerophilaceae bacterium]
MFNKEKPVEVIIDKEKCTKCGICIGYCHEFLGKDQDGYPKAMPVENTLAGCIQCGHCMMACPNSAIEIKGEDISKSHLREFGNAANFEELNNLFLKRRSIRKFKKDEVSKEVLDKIIQAAATAAVSIPPSELKVLVISGSKKVQELAEEIVQGMKKFPKMFNPISLNLMKIFAGETNYRMFKEFIIPLCKITVEARDRGEDYLFYNAPAVILFYSTELSDKEDSLIAATQATLAAEALGLGTCWIGSLGAVFQHNEKLRKKYGILKNEKIGSGFVVGYPDTKFYRAFQRNFKNVTFIS